MKKKSFNILTFVLVFVIVTSISLLNTFAAEPETDFLKIKSLAIEDNESKITNYVNENSPNIHESKLKLEYLISNYDKTPKILEEDVDNYIDAYCAYNNDIYSKNSSLIKNINSKIYKKFELNFKKAKKNPFFIAFLDRFFNNSKAVEYAQKYALEYNPEYIDFNSLGGDCINFVSQCLSSGRLVQQDCFKTDMVTIKNPNDLDLNIQNWYYTKGEIPVFSKTWINTDYFNTYITKRIGEKNVTKVNISDVVAYNEDGSVNETTTRTNLIEKVLKFTSKGDPFILAKKDTGRTYHSMIFSDVDPIKGDALYCGHNNNRLNKSLFSVLSGLTNDTIIVYHLK